MRKSLVSVVSASLIALAVTGAGCSGGGADAGLTPDPAATPAPVMTVSLTNWAIKPSARVLAAGVVTLTVTHEADHGGGHAGSEGGAIHQLYLGALMSGTRSGEGKYGPPLVNLTDIKPGETRSVEVGLRPGTYELGCLVIEDVGGKKVNHYEKGMHTLVVVR